MIKFRPKKGSGRGARENGKSLKMGLRIDPGEEMRRKQNSSASAKDDFREWIGRRWCEISIWRMRSMSGGVGVVRVAARRNKSVWKFWMEAWQGRWAGPMTSPSRQTGMSRYRCQLKGAQSSKKVLATSRESSNLLPAAALLGNLQKKLEAKRVTASGMLLFATDRSTTARGRRRLVGSLLETRFAEGSEKLFQLQEHHSMCGLC